MSNDIQERSVTIDNLKINYKVIGDGNIPIILLHGWGINSDKYIETAKQLFLQTTNYKLQTSIFVPDLPGFGKSDNPLEAWSVSNYAGFVKKFSDTVLSDAKNIILIGHSFGGRIAIKFSAQYPERLAALILTGAAGIKHPSTIKQKIFYILAKAGKAVFSLPIINYFSKNAEKFLYKAASEKDYYQTHGIMKETFKKIIEEDLTPGLEKIKTPTLLVWGKNDKSTPLTDGRLMHSKIKNSKLKILDDSDHRAPYQYPEKFAKIVLDFIIKK